MKKANQQTGETCREESSLLGSFFYMPRKDTKRQRLRKRMEPPSPDRCAMAAGPIVDMAFIQKGQSFTANLHEVGERLRNLSKNTKKKDGNSSEPSAPLPTARGRKPSHTCTRPDSDIYRILYLLLRVDQQSAYLEQMLKRMRKRKKYLQTDTYHNVYLGMSRMKNHLINIRDNRTEAREMFQTPEELSEFLRAVEEVCIAVERLPSGSKNIILVQDMLDCILAKDKKQETRKRSRVLESLRTLMRIKDSSDTSTGQLFVNLQDGLTDPSNNHSIDAETDSRQDVCTKTGPDDENIKSPVWSKSESKKNVDRRLNELKPVRMSAGTTIRFVCARKYVNQSDPFIEELDKLLDECTHIN